MPLTRRNTLMIVFLALGLAAAGAVNAHWGEDVTPGECAARKAEQRLEAFLSGEARPYAYYGPPEECDNQACKHDYYAHRCRFTGVKVPACPAEARADMVQALRGFAGNGSAWAADALTLLPCELWEEVRGRTAWFVGDSVMQDTAAALVCFLVEYFETAQDAPPVTQDSVLMHRLLHNANNVKVNQWCLLFKEDTKICYLRGNYAPRIANVMLPALRALADPRDILVLNFGLWSNDMDELRMHANMFKVALDFHRGMLPARTFWRETTPQHYSTLNGMYAMGVPTRQQRCQPIFPGVNLTLAADGSVGPLPGAPLPEAWSPAEWEMKVLLQGGQRNYATQPVIEELGLHSLRTWNTSLGFWQFHHHYHHADDGSECVTIDCDCTHSCEPSWAPLWLPQLLQALRNPSMHMAGARKDWREAPPAAPAAS